MAVVAGILGSQAVEGIINYYNNLKYVDAKMIDTLKISTDKDGNQIRISKGYQGDIESHNGFGVEHAWQQRNAQCGESWKKLGYDSPKDLINLIDNVISTGTKNIGKDITYTSSIKTPSGEIKTFVVKVSINHNPPSFQTMRWK